MAHRHLLGQSATGQNTLTKAWLLDDIKNGHAVCFIDLTGHETADIINRIPPKRTKDVLDWNISRYSIPHNPLTTETTPLTADTLATAIKYGFGFADTPTARMSGLLYNLLVALIEAHQGLFGLFLMLDSPEYRKHVLGAVSDPVVLRYWAWYDSLPTKQQYEERSSTYNKVQMLMADPRIRAVSGIHSAFDLKDMVKDKILFIQLPQGELGVEKSTLLANLWLTQIHQARMSTDTSIPFSLYISEFYKLAPVTLKDILAGGTAYDMSLTVANHYLDQVEPSLMDSLQANADQYIFRVSPEDAKRLPAVKPQDFQLYETPPFEYVHFSHGTYTRDKIPELTHLTYANSAKTVHNRMLAKLHSPATREIKALLERFS